MKSPVEKNCFLYLMYLKNNEVTSYILRVLNYQAHVSSLYCEMTLLTNSRCIVTISKRPKVKKSFLKTLLIFSLTCFLTDPDQFDEHHGQRGDSQHQQQQ